MNGTELHIEFLSDEYENLINSKTLIVLTINLDHEQFQTKDVIIWNLFICFVKNTEIVLN